MSSPAADILKFSILICLGQLAKWYMRAFDKILRNKSNNNSGANGLNLAHLIPNTLFQKYLPVVPVSNF